MTDAAETSREGGSAAGSSVRRGVAFRVGNSMDEGWESEGRGGGKGKVEGWLPSVVHIGE